MPRAAKLAPSKDLRRETLQKMLRHHTFSDEKAEMIALKLAYGEDSKLLTGYVNSLVYIDRIYPNHRPTQASYRWSTTNPPITNWPRACIEPACQQRLRELYGADRKYGYIEHSWTDTCWSVRDVLVCDDDEYMVSWDHDDIEGRIYALRFNYQEAIQAYRDGIDRHTITCCNIFGYRLPHDLRNPHSSIEDAEWRTTYNWQGKDTKARVLAKNFNHGSKFTETPMFVYMIKGIEQYGVDMRDLVELAKVYIASLGDVWTRKVALMREIQRRREARTLYGARRLFYSSDAETGREGLSHTISGTVSHYNNATLLKLWRAFGHDMRLMHNAHDGNKIAFKKAKVEMHYDSLEEFKQALKGVIERDITWNGKSLKMTAGIKVA